MWTILLAVVGILAVCSGVRITKVYQFENVVGGPGRHRTPWRSGASGDASLHMFKGDAIKIDLCIPVTTNIRLDDLVYSNDGLSDVIRVNIDNGVYVEAIVTKENSNGWGRFWNDHVSTGKISEPLKLQPGLHSLTLTIEDADCYGTELDALFVSLGADIDDNFLWCGVEFIRSMKPSPCAPDFGMPIQPEDIIATEPPLIDIYDGLAPQTNDYVTDVPGQRIVSTDIFSTTTGQSLRHSTTEYTADIHQTHILEKTTVPHTTVQENNIARASTNVDANVPSYVPYPVVKELTSTATSVSDTTKSTTNVTIHGITINKSPMEINTTPGTKSTAIVDHGTSEIDNVTDKTLPHLETSIWSSAKQTTMSTTLLASVRDALRTTKLNAETIERMMTDKSATLPVKSFTEATETTPRLSRIHPTTMEPNTGVYFTNHEQSKQPETIITSTEEAPVTTVNIIQNKIGEMTTTSRYQSSTEMSRNIQLTTLSDEVTTPATSKANVNQSSEVVDSKPYLSENPQTITDSAIPFDGTLDANKVLTDYSTTTIKPSILLTTIQMANYAINDPDATSTSKAITAASNNIFTSNTSTITVQPISVNWDIPQTTDSYMDITVSTTVPQTSDRTTFTYPITTSTSISATIAASEIEYAPITITKLSPNSTIQVPTHKPDTRTLKTRNNTHITTPTESTASTSTPTTSTSTPATSTSTPTTFTTTSTTSTNASTSSTDKSTSSTSTLTASATASTISTIAHTTSTSASTTSRTISTNSISAYTSSRTASTTSTRASTNSTSAPTTSTSATTTSTSATTTSTSAPTTSSTVSTTSTNVSTSSTPESTISTNETTTSTNASTTSTSPPTTSKSTTTTSISASTTSTSAPIISTSASTTSTSVPITSTTSTNRPTISTSPSSTSAESVPITSTSASTASTIAPTTPTSIYTASFTSAQTTSTSAPITSTSASTTSTTVSTTHTSEFTSSSGIIATSTNVPTTTSSSRGVPTTSTSTSTISSTASSTSTTASTTSAIVSTTRNTTTVQPSEVMSDTSVTTSHVNEPNISIGSVATLRPYPKFVEQRSYLGGCINETNVNIVFNPDTLRSLEIVAKSESKFSPSVSHIAEDKVVQLREKCESNVWQIGSQDGSNRELGLPLGNVRILDFDVNSHAPSKHLFPRSLYTLSTKGVFLRYVIPNDIHFRRGRLRLTVGLFDVYNNFSIGVQYYNRARRNPSKVQYRTFSPLKQIQQWLIPIKVVSPSLENLLQLRFDDSVQNRLNFDFLRLEYIPATWKMRRMVLNRSSKWKVNGQVYVERKGNKEMPDGMTVHINGQKQAGVYADVNIVRKPNMKVVNINDDGEIYVTHKLRAAKGGNKDGKKQEQIITDLSGFTFGGADRRIIKVDVFPRESEVTITYDDGHYIRCQFDYNNDKSLLKIVNTSFGAVPVRFFSMYMSSDLAAVNELIVDRMERRHIMSKYVGGNVGTTFTFLKTSTNPVFSTNSETTIRFLRPRTHK